MKKKTESSFKMQLWNGGEEIAQRKFDFQTQIVSSSSLMFEKGHQNRNQGIQSQITTQLQFNIHLPITQKPLQQIQKKRKRKSFIIFKIPT